MASSGSDVSFRTTHVLDTMRYLGGDVERVAATLEHETGTVGSVSSTVAGSEWTVELDVVGDDLQLHLDYANQTLTGVVDGEEIDFDGTCDRYAREVEGFLDACAAGDPTRYRCPYTDAARTLDLNWAIIDAVNAGEQVELG